MKFGVSSLLFPDSRGIKSSEKHREKATEHRGGPGNDSWAGCPFAATIMRKNE